MLEKNTVVPPSKQAFAKRSFHQAQLKEKKKQTRVTLSSRKRNNPKIINKIGNSERGSMRPQGSSLCKNPPWLDYCIICTPQPNKAVICPQSYFVRWGYTVPDI
jgi:hypothetical protein